MVHVVLAFCGIDHKQSMQRVSPLSLSTYPIANPTQPNSCMLCSSRHSHLPHSSHAAVSKFTVVIAIVYLSLSQIFCADGHKLLCGIICADGHKWSARTRARADYPIDRGALPVLLLARMRGVAWCATVITLHCRYSPSLVD